MKKISINAKKDFVLIAKVKDAHGIQGNFIVRSFSCEPHSILKMSLITEDLVPFKIHLRKFKNVNELICSTENVKTRNDAEKLKGLDLYVHKMDLPKIEDGEFYIANLVGLEVKNPELENIGKIITITNFGAGDIVEIKFIDKEETEFFPFTNEYFPYVEDYVVLKL